MSGFFDFTVKFPLCCPYGTDGQQLEGIETPFDNLPVIMIGCANKLRVETMVYFHPFAA